MKLKPLALAIGVSSPLVAMASTVTVTAETASSEYLEVVGGVQAAAQTLALGAQYAAGDVITLTYNQPHKSGATATTGFSFPATLAISVATQFTSGGSTTTAAATNGAVALFDSGDDFVSYRVTVAPNGGIDAADGSTPDFGSISLPRPFFQGADMGTGDVTVTPSSATSQGVAFDAGTGKTIIDQTGSQYKYAITGLSQIVDVESDRKLFAVGTTTASSHAIGIVASTATGSSAPSNAATDATMSVTLTGDFSWLDSDATTTGIQTAGISVNNATTVAVSATQMSFSVVATGATNAIVFQNTASAVIPTQSLTMSVSKVYNNGSTNATGTSTTSGTGAYTLNGSSVTVYAIPTSASVSNFIWLTNTGATDGEVSLVVHDNGTDYDLGVVGTSSAGSELDISALLAAGLDAAGVTLSGGRVHMDIVTKVPSADIAVSAAYRVGDDRVNLLTSIETDQD